MFKTDATRVRRVSQFEVFFCWTENLFSQRIENHYLNVEWLHWTCQPNCVTIVSPHIIQYHTTQTGQSWVEFGMGVRVRAREREVRVFSDTILLHSTSHLEKTLSSSSFRRVPQKEEMHCFCLGRTRGRRGEAETGRHPSIIEQGLKKGEYLCPPWSLIPLSWKPCVPASVTQHCT